MCSGSISPALMSVPTEIQTPSLGETVFGSPHLSESAGTSPPMRTCIYIGQGSISQRVIGSRPVGS